MSQKRFFGAKLSLLANTVGVSQTELADRVGVTPATINRYFNGKRDLHASAFIAVLKELGFDIDQMVSKKMNKISNIDSDPKSMREALLYLFDELDELGKQTYLSQLLWAAKLSKGEKFSKQVEQNIKKEISLI